MRLCCVAGCGQTLGAGIRMYPNVSHKKGKKELSLQRQNAWMSALGKTLSVSVPNAFQEWEVCSSHFISGKMASLEDIDNMDWVPSINLRKEQSGRTPILRCSVLDCTASNQGYQGCSFYRIPKVNECGESRQFLDETASAWLSVLGIHDDCPATHGSVYVCQAHYKIEKEKKRKSRRQTSNAPAIPSGDAPESYDETFTNDVKSANFHIFPRSHPKDSQTTNKLPSMPANSFSSSKDDPPFLKSGEILRNDAGKFVFLCGHCGDYNVDCLAMMNHINEHFDEKVETKMPLTLPLSLPEFVSCTDEDVKNVKTEPRSGDTIQELTAPETLVKSETSRPRGRPPKRSCKMERIDTSVDGSSDTSEPELPIQESEPTDSMATIEQDSSHSEWSCSTSDEDYDETKKKNPKKRSKETKSSKVVPKRCRLLPNNCYQCSLEPPMGNETDLRRHKCVICKEWLNHHSDFKTHLHVAHGRDNLDDVNALATEYNEFTCYICESSVRSLSYLRFHMKAHFDKYLKFQCDECGLVRRSKCALRQHMQKHVNKPTECDLCNRVFQNNWRMRRHRVHHQSELAFICEVCSKGFKLRKYLTRHMAVHSDRKVHCRYCDKSFSFATSRRAHEKSQHNVT